jgi:signal transduction histidine kinase
MLHDFIATNRAQIIVRCRERLATRSLSVPTEPEMDHGVPLFLDQLVNALRSPEQSNVEIGASAALHGHDLLLKGFTVSQVVHDYGGVCQTITELALEKDEPIDTASFRTLNRCLDDAIAGAVTMYGRESERSSLDGETERGNQRMGFFTHELRNLVNTAIVAFAAMKTGNVGVGGSTAAVLERSLANLRDLIARSLAEVRLTAGVQNREPISVPAFIAALADVAALEAEARGRTLTVSPIDAALTVEADEKVLSAVVVNLLQNAFKFSPPRSTVRLDVSASAGHVLIEVHDECGGLPGGDLNGLFRPYEQRGADRTGVGLGLAFCRWGAEANDGRLYARNLPGTGCVFTLELPRSSMPVAHALTSEVS